MPLPKTSSADIEEHLDRLGVGPGDRLVVHSRLLAFGEIEGGAQAVADALLRRIGPTGTLVVPSYVFDASKPYDPATSPGEGVGVLSEIIRRMPGAIRSACPIHNHAGIGPAAEILRHSDPTRSMGRGSDFDLMLQDGFGLLLLGCSFTEGATILHHSEAVFGVPYRRWILSPRPVLGADGTISILECDYFARARTDLRTHMEPVVTPLVEQGKLRSARCPFGTSYACALADIHEAALAMLAADPHALVQRLT